MVLGMVFVTCLLVSNLIAGKIWNVCGRVMVPASVIFIVISFAGLIPNDQLFRMIIYQYLFKVIFEIIFTPLTYYVTGTLKKKEGIDTYDYDADYRLF